MAPSTASAVSDGEDYVPTATFSPFPEKEKPVPVFAHGGGGEGGGREREEGGACPPLALCENIVWLMKRGSRPRRQQQEYRFAKVAAQKRLPSADLGGVGFRNSYSRQSFGNTLPLFPPERSQQSRAQGAPNRRIPGAEKGSLGGLVLRQPRGRIISSGRESGSFVLPPRPVVREVGKSRAIGLAPFV